ncbi:S8 family serine peptidase [Flavisolibacter nicotianae]|uniref:S8 family serine peptidase n=1 Tax=Flavisolibacter nicotianae TaxID=2364882 RepID=UPI000EB00191|nr:S8 family serine peptidase [Flavisolibacter nicotianae]
MKQFLVSLLILTAAASNAQSYGRYIVRFKNKATTPYAIANPLPYLSQRAIDRRTTYNIAIDSTDLPVTSRYIDSVRLAGAVTILNVSRWLNQVSIQTNDAAALAKIASFAFVERTAPIAAKRVGDSGKEGIQAKRFSNRKLKKARHFKPAADYFNYGSSFPQIHIHNGEFLHNIGLRGQGMVIGMIDAGFYHYTTLKAFDSVNQNGQVLGVYDFVAKDNSVIEDHTHGMQCFSVIAANVPGQFVGSAPKAGFYLFRSEDAASEYPIEEHNWVCAAERVDSAGGDVISSSLGYNTFDDASFNHTYADLNGNTTMAAIGADLAAKKGILVLNSAGNEGAGSWGKIVTPADGDSVLAVGAVSASGIPGSFSSRGPSADGQVKPDVASVGVNAVVQTASNTIGTNNGTSFSCPNMAGLATCLWQGFREFNNMRIVKAIQQAGDRVTTPNDTTGYGIPDMVKATLLLLKDFSSATATTSACKTSLAWTSKDAKGMRYEIERKAPGETAFSKIGEKAAAGTIFGTQHYQFTDSLINIQAGTLTYRIRQWADTASSVAQGADYIDTVSVVLASSCITTPVTNVPVSAEEFVVSPNPAIDQIRCRLTTTYPIPQLTLRLVDSKGAIVQVVHTSKLSGTATFELPLRQLAKGSYYVAAYNGEKRIATKEFMKL